MYTVIFKSLDGQHIILNAISPGTNLLDIALANNIEIACLCGGNGVCKSCHITVESGAEYIMPADSGSGQPPETTLYACQSVLSQNMSGTLVINTLTDESH